MVDRTFDDRCHVDPVCRNLTAYGDKDVHRREQVGTYKTVCHQESHFYAVISGGNDGICGVCFRRV